MVRLLAICALALALTVASAGTASANGAREPAQGDREAAQYEAYRQPQKIVAALKLASGQRVADVGAGRGFLTSRLAAAVGPSGFVVATDVDRAALAAIRRAPGVETRVVAPDDPGLEAGAYDRILVAEVDHYLPDRTAWLRRAAVALKPGGFIAVTNRVTYREALVAAAKAAGLRVTEEQVGLPAHFFVRVER